MYDRKHMWTNEKFKVKRLGIFFIDGSFVFFLTLTETIMMYIIFPMNSALRDRVIQNKADSISQ